MKYLVLFLLHNALLQTADSIKLRRKWLRWKEPNVTFGSLIGLMESVSLKMCLAKCQETRGCAAAYVNEATSTCELSQSHPSLGSFMNVFATPRPGWTSFYLDSIEVKGVQAWQSTIYADCAANYAIDGNNEENVCLTTMSCGCLCAVTTGGDSRWVMELASADYVTSLVLNFRVGNPVELWRNTNFSIFVHDSFEDAKNEDGTLCGTYIGEKISEEIVFICTQSIYGKALRIQDIKKSPAIMNVIGIQLCELRVFIV